MINVTEQAKQELKRLHDAYVNWPGGCLRIEDRGQGKLGLGIDLEKPDDTVVEYEGIRLLAFEPGIANSTRRVTIDVDSNRGATELVIDEES